MSSDETDIDYPVGIVNPHDKPVFVSGNIKNCAAILKNTDAANFRLNIGRRTPVGFFRNLTPGKKLGFCTGWAGLSQKAFNEAIGIIRMYFL